MSGNNIQRLQVIDPAVLKSLLEQLNPNTKRQTLANIIDVSGMNEIVHDYDKFVAAPENSKLKESYRQNLISRIQKYKGRKRISLSDNQTHSGQNQDVPEEMSSERRKVKLAVQSVKRFKQVLDDKGIRRSTNGKLVDINGQETNFGL